jgi:hypothetical protein
MNKGSANPATPELSYELYKELIEELLSPIEPSMDAQVRYELYLSKLVYLENLQEQCFRSVNCRKAASARNAGQSFTAEDLSTIREALASTHEHLRTAILEALNHRLSQTGTGNVGV